MSETTKGPDSQIVETTVKTVTSPENNVIRFPDFQKFKDHVEAMRTELSMLLLERDELRFVICKNIETAYYLAFGALEYKVYEAECETLRLKRKIELIQARLNRQEKIILVQIEAVLDREFEEYQARLKEQLDKMNEALERKNAEFLTPEENKLLKKLYRKIVKKLHHDLNPDISAGQMRLFENALTAYKDGDLEALKIIEEMVRDRAVQEDNRDALSKLKEETARLEKMLSTVRDSITQIKSRYPYSFRDVVEDPEKEAERKAELEFYLTQYQALIEIYKKKLAEMMMRCSHE